VVRVDRERETLPQQSKRTAGAEDDENCDTSDRDHRREVAYGYDGAIDARDPALDSAVEQLHVFALRRALGLQCGAPGGQSLEPRAHGSPRMFKTSRCNSVRVASSSRGF